MGTEDFGFGRAIEVMEQGAMVSRRDWDRGRIIYIGLQAANDRDDKNTLAYLYMVKDGERFPATLSNESLLAKDWHIMDLQSGSDKGEEDEDDEEAGDE